MSAEPTRLDSGWEIASAAPGACTDPPQAFRDLDWRPARCGTGGGLTAAGALEDPHGASTRDYDAEDWWFRISPRTAAPEAREELTLVLGGLATLAEVWVDGDLRLRSESMFAAHELALVDGLAELVICCRALAPRLAERRRPRARWRTRLVDGNLRFVRTMLLGRAPGFAPGPAVVGPWRGARVVRHRGARARSVALRAHLHGDEGVLEATGRVRAAATVTVTVAGRETEVRVGDDGTFAASVTVPGVTRWWPHTHGQPVLHEVTLRSGDELLHGARVGFRTLQHSDDLASDGPALRVNGVPVFCRGAVWTPQSLADPHGDPATLRMLLGTAAAAGMNMLRIPGTGTYESDAFHDLCDELGILVWQDLMFANLDYPESDPEFMAQIEREVSAELARLAGRPSLAVVCGGSEVAQQVSMLGLDPGLAHGPLYGELLPRLVAEAGIDSPYVPSSPWGGELPFRPSHGLAHYFGVGAYLRGLEDARRAELRFASECLAFANVPDDDALAPGELYGPAWKAGTPRDAGAGWDFDDVRDHYLASLFGVDPAAERRADPDRYLELSRLVSAEAMAETFGEWRRDASPCSGALVLWLKDLAPGAGWGLLDHRGVAKAALGPVARVLAPVAVWTTDEGLNGIAIHAANDGAEALRATLRVTLYREGSSRVSEAERALALPAHGHATTSVEEVLGHFVDAGWAYRFGPPAADTIVVSLEGEDGMPLSQAFRFAVARPLQRRSAAELGLRTALAAPAGALARVEIAADRLLYGVRLAVPGWAAADDAFCVEPGRPRTIELRRTAADGEGPRGELRAANLLGLAQLLS